MKLKNAFFYTLREDAKDEDSISGNLLVKAGFIKKVSAGVYMMLPLGHRVQAKVEAIIRKHMDVTGAQELKMPALIAAEYYEKSGRLKNFGPDLFQLKDRGGKDMVLGPTHEELFAVAAKAVIRSYKDMPFNIYQIQNKYRDEPRARYGLIRVKEFVMKDAYSFDTDENSLHVAYMKMFNAYKDIFDELGINYRIVRADTGMMGGLLSEEFQALAPLGEDVLVTNDECSYAANLEIATRLATPESDEKKLVKEEVATPNAKTIEEVCAFLHLPAERFVKTLIYRGDGHLLAVCVRGNREVAEGKLKKVLHCQNLELASSDEVEKVTGAPVGFAGPCGLTIPVILDQEVSALHNFIVGANKKDTHLLNVNLEDFVYDRIADITVVMPGDLCAINGKPLEFSKGIEIGNTFKLGTKYAKALGLSYLDQQNHAQDVWMGSYGIGVGRTIAAIVEQNHDEQGIIWPENIAPFQVAIVPISTKDDIQMQVAEDLYTSFQQQGIDVLFDDRAERAGVKFNDMELIGIPYRITVGRKASEGIIEWKNRKNGESKEITIAEAKKFFVEKADH